LAIVDWFEGANLNITGQSNPRRTVYNPRTRAYEELPLAEFQHLLRQGKIEETDSQAPYDGHPQRVYRLI
jgi:hypothetical protein